MMPFLLASATSAFNPQTQGSLVAWYDASTLGLSNGDTLVTFTDSKTGSPYSLSKSYGGASNATYATAQQNGLGTVSWPSGVGFGGGGSTASTYPYTLVAVVKPTNLSGARTILGPFQNNGGLQLRLDVTTGKITLNKANIANIGTSSSGISAGSYALVVATVSSSAYAFQIDGVASGSGSHSQTLTASMTFEMGLQKTNEEPFIGYIAEIQIYNTVLSSGDLSALHTYIVNKWATP